MDETAFIPVTAFNQDTIIKIGQMLSFISIFLSLAITQVFQRRAFVRWRMDLWICLAILWFSIILILVDLFLYPHPVYPFNNLWTTLGVAIWVVGIFLLMRVFWYIFHLELQGFSKPKAFSDPSKQYFKFFYPKFGANCIDKVIDDVISRNKDKILFPMILAADESWRPWVIAEGFSDNALNIPEKNAGVIWFCFSRPHEPGLAASPVPRYLPGPCYEVGSKVDNKITIDCFDPFCKMKDDRERGLLFADPRNAHQMNEKYNLAIGLLKDRGCEKLCVIYDALSDFLFFSDKEIAAQYLRHNMAWEATNRVCSIYIFRFAIPG